MTGRYTIAEGIGVYLERSFMKYFNPEKAKKAFSEIYHNAGVDVDAELDKIFSGCHDCLDETTLDYFFCKLVLLANKAQDENHGNELLTRPPHFLEELVCGASGWLFNWDFFDDDTVIWLPRRYPWERDDSYPQDEAEVRKLFFDSLSTIFDVDETIVNEALVPDLLEVKYS